MKNLDELINRLISIRDDCECGNAPISIMQEHEVNNKPIQFSSHVYDVAVSKRYVKGVYKGVSEIVIIGQEII